MKDIYAYNDEELMRLIKVDNMLAFDAIYNKYCRKVYKFGYSILKSVGESEDLVQSVFVNLWENRSNVEKEASVKSYLFTIAYNSAVSIIRKKTRESKFIEYLKSLQEINQEDVDIELEFIELTEKVDEILKDLPPRQKKVYLMHKVDGLKYKEIAEQLNISVNTVENHMASALKFIRKKLDH